ncbi:hypothetical protein [Psychrobacter pygoscelis]|uniref:hypothetical protein n=1 Tax=Psychrobacter pygoscelis TaxID=2488563 RepID=UPI00103EFDC8|nr:hypothetical protein [Psychrobacter pygoscelis]
MHNINCKPLITSKSIKAASAAILVSGLTLLSGCATTEITKDPAEVDRQMTDMQQQVNMNITAPQDNQQSQ